MNRPGTRQKEKEHLSEGEGGNYYKGKEALVKVKHVPVRFEKGQLSWVKRALLVGGKGY